MARTDNINNFLTDVADSIRTKTGKSDAISASSFDTEIASITTSEDLDTELATYNTELTEQEESLSEIVEYLENKIESGEGVLDMYSTKETKTNKVWIDGKPIYRKVITSTQALKAGSNAIAHNIDNLGMLVHADLFANFNTHIYTNHVYNSGTEFLGITFITPEDFGVQVGSGWGSSFTQGFTVILEYTKTTE